MYSVRTLLQLRQLFPSSRIHHGVVHRARAASSLRRCLHSLPPLPYDIDEGLGDFLSPAALRIIAVDYQQGLLTRLNEQVKGTEMENQSVVQTVISAASDRRHALAFNYASQALNNSFFLQYLKPPPPGKRDTEEPQGNSAFMGDIRENFDTLGQLKSTFSAAALGMINSGWVWLVSDENRQMQVVGTFGAGTLLVRSRRHMVEDEGRPILGEARASVYKAPATSSSPTSGMQKTTPRPSPPTRPGAQHMSSLTGTSNRPNIYDEESLAHPSRSPEQYNNIGDILTPLLCVSVHEHAWMGAGYGVWGKEEYLKRFWTVVNWEAVSQAHYRATSP